ncbi:hypothetical protein [Limnoglobus roseus]|uniref:Uncharacterized protein n=1 Tax=Limnoglobus roseus TaxID=2598579 RepID=A0A5C1API4_9BACT|nr:hypothetical protein [Limnoglobus roseus]QEL18778.1 hypothetical protein PX52LOC_05817 [Limnoglobus roseus]
MSDENKMVEAWIKFNCAGCQRPIRVEDDMGGLEFPCRKCGVVMVIPEKSGMTPEIVSEAPTPKKKTVSMSMSMPRGLGAMKTEVSQKTADSMASTFLGGLLAVVGAIIMGMFMRRGGRA